MIADTVPALRRPSRNARRAVWSMLRRACDVAAVVHVVFLVLFASIGLPLLVWVNVASIALFVVSRALLKRRRNLLASSLVAGEVVLHAAIASLLLGWDSGFHYYLLTLVGPLMVTIGGSPRSRVARLLVFGAGYAALDAASRLIVPVYLLNRYLLDSLRYLNVGGTLAIMAFISLTYYRLVTAAEGELRALASTDPLTGLHNRRHLTEVIRDLRSAGPPRQALCVLICDIDHFKQVNDRHGHEMGDLVLQRVAQVLQAAVRPTDLVARWGGEEFVVLLPQADAAMASDIGERIRQAVAALSIGASSPSSSPPGQPVASCGADALGVTITVGAACVDPCESVDSALARADAALYRGKSAGRNRVVSSTDPARVVAMVGPG